MADVWQTIETTTRSSVNMASLPPVTGGVISGAYPATATSVIIAQLLLAMAWLGWSYKSSAANVLRRINADANPDVNKPNRDWIEVTWMRMNLRLLLVQGTAFLISVAFAIQFCANSFLYLRNYESIYVHVVTNESSKVLSQINIVVGLVGILLTALWYQSISIASGSKAMKLGFAVPHLALCILQLVFSAVIAGRIDTALLPTKWLIAAAVVSGIAVVVALLAALVIINGKNFTGSKGTKPITGRNGLGDVPLVTNTDYSHNA